MKKAVLALSVLTAAGLLTGCSLDKEKLEAMVERVDMDGIADWMVERSRINVDNAKTAEEIQADLPRQLAVVTVDDTVLDCQVAHLAIKERKTDYDRQTDQVVCETTIEGEGVFARFCCTLDYTYTRSHGWALVDWELDSRNLTLNVSEGALTEQLADSVVQELSLKYGPGGVTYQGCEWNPDTMVCVEQFAVDASEGLLTTEGTVTVNAALSLDMDKGLCYNWKTSVEDDNLVHSADLAGTAWMAQGALDTAEAKLALKVEDIDTDTGKLLVSAVSGVAGEYGGTDVRSFENKTVSWNETTEGEVSFTIRAGDYTWECCFDSGKQWARLNGSYVGELIQEDSEADLKELLETGGSGSVQALDYEFATDARAWNTSGGETVYEMTVNYPKFSGSGSDEVNRLMKEKIEKFFSEPAVDTQQSALDAMPEAAEKKFLSLPCYSRVEISVVYNRGGYLSMLLSRSQRLADGDITYHCDCVNYDLNEKRELERSDVISGDKNTLAALLCQYAEDSTQHNESTMLSYAQAWVLGRNGIVFYVESDEGNGRCRPVTIPYSEEVCKINNIQ